VTGTSLQQIPAEKDCAAMALETAEVSAGKTLEAPKKLVLNWKRVLFILLGLVLFFAFYFMNSCPCKTLWQALHAAQAGWPGLF
jgi:hypothetical protein